MRRRPAVTGPLHCLAGVSDDHLLAGLEALGDTEEFTVRGWASWFLHGELDARVRRAA